MAWWEPQTWDWAFMVKTAIGAGFGTAIVQTGFAAYRDYRHRKAQAAYMALRLAVILESYASACSDLMAYNANAERHPDEPYPAWKTILPELPPYPDDADGWRSIDLKLASQCLSFRNRIHDSQRVIDSAIEYAMDELENTLNEYVAERGTEAWRLAVDLRSKHGVLRADMVWDYAEGLESMLKMTKKTTKERQEEQATFLRSFLSSRADIKAFP